MTPYLPHRVKRGEKFPTMTICGKNKAWNIIMYLSLSPSLFPSSNWNYMKYHLENIDGFPNATQFSVTHYWYWEILLKDHVLLKSCTVSKAFFSAIFLRVKDQRIFESKWARWKHNILVQNRMQFSRTKKYLVHVQPNRKVGSYKARSVLE